jgi:CheY-like chemotaxis protein
MGKGSTFHIYLPLMDQTDTAARMEVNEDLPVGNEHILLVDDEEAIARLEKQMLERLGYTVAVRNSSTDALQAFQSSRDSFDLVITDMTMPNMTGDRLATALMSIRPDIPVIICTGFSEKINNEKAKKIGIKGLLMKPVVLSELAQMVRNVLDEAKAGAME